MEKAVGQPLKIKSPKEIKKSLERKCERLWKECVRLSANNTCEYPGCNAERLIAQMHHHHFFNRKCKSTIWWVPNGVYLCAYHHKFSDLAAHEDPFFKDVIEKTRHSGWLDDLLLRKRTVVKYNIPFLEWNVLYLQSYLTELRKIKGVITHNDEGSSSEQEDGEANRKERTEEEGNSVANGDIPVDTI